MPLDDVQKMQLGNTRVLATPSVKAKVAARLSATLVDSLADVTDDVETLIVVAGGDLLDQAKIWRAHNAPAMRLIAIPSIWGSGAEVSQVAVLNQQGNKEIMIGEQYLPDICGQWPELATSIPENKALEACGDAWSHALEGFFSPLASPQIRKAQAAVIQEMLNLPLGNDSRWFMPSAQASAGQAQSGVGLIHGIAHTLEGLLCTHFPDAAWGHAKLCALFLWPVMLLNIKHSEKWNRYNSEYHIDGDAILATLKNLFDQDAYNQALTFLSMHWNTVIRDRCTRMNSVLIRPGYLSHFTEQTFICQD